LNLSKQVPPGIVDDDGGWFVEGFGDPGRILPPISGGSGSPYESPTGSGDTSGERVIFSGTIGTTK
jgi:hypothetical protein